MDVDLRKDDWFGEFERLAEFWLGPRGENFGYNAAELKDHRVPDGLHWFLRFGGRWPHPLGSPFANAFSTLNRIDLPDLGASYVDGLVRFGTGPQAFFDWATLATEADDAPVYGSSGEEPVVGDTWDLYWNSLNDFLRSVLVGSLTQLWWASGSNATTNPIVRDLVGRLDDGQLLAEDRLHQARLEATCSLTFDDIAANDWIIVRRSDEAFSPMLAFRSAEARNRFMEWLSAHGTE